MLTLPALPLFRESDRHRRALFVTYGAGHIAKIAPVIRAMERQGIECLVIALTIGHKKAVQLGLKPLGYQDFLALWGERAGKVLERGRSLSAGNTHPDVDDYETACYLGTNFEEWVDVLGEEQARQRYVEQGRHGFLPVRFMGKVLDALRPGVVVATSTPRSEEACIRAAVERRIPTLTMVDLFAPPSDPFLRRPVHADRITVVSQEVKTQFVASGIPSEKIVVTGSPDFDELFEREAVSAGAQFRQKHGWHHHRVILWAGILEPEDATFPGSMLGIEVENRLRSWVRSRADVALVVRYHPGQYHQFPAQLPERNVHNSDAGSEPIAPLLNACDVVIHQVSTVGLQAALLRKRVLHLEFSKWVQNVDFDLSSFGVSEGIPALDDLVPALDSPSPFSICKKMNVPTGPSAGRVAAQVTALLENERHPR
jgi:hypothetical protein